MTDCTKEAMCDLHNVHCRAPDCEYGRAIRPVVDRLNAEVATGDPWVVWSNEHMAWWRPNRRGYCTNLRGAGIYSEAEAKDCEGLRSLMRDGRVPEVAMPLSQALRSDDETGKPLSEVRKDSVGELLISLYVVSRRTPTGCDRKGGGGE